jgi:hypothetical protein
MGNEVIPDFLRDEPYGPAQLDVGQPLLAQVKHGLEADAEVFGRLLGRPEVRFGRGFGVLGNDGISEARGMDRRVHGMEYDQWPLPFMVTAFIFLFRFGGGVGMVKMG